MAEEATSEAYRYGEYDGEQSQSKWIVANRLREVGLGVRRFIHLEPGQKQSYDHTLYLPCSIRGNYGVYTGGGLVGVDIDDHDPETPALDDLPLTFTVSTPHGGEHRYYHVTGRPVRRMKLLTRGSTNASLRWGDLHVEGKYLVGPGSELEECDKRDCDKCREQGSKYSIEVDRPIVSIESVRLAELLVNDPGFDYGGGVPSTFDDFR